MACKSRSVRLCLYVGLTFVFGCTTLSGAQDKANLDGVQPSAEQARQGAPGSDLAAAAKLAREQQAEQKARRTDRSEAVNEMAGDLALAQDEPITGAPTGYRYYYFKEGDYAILVPIDAKPQARDSYGLRLVSSEALTSSIEVILGEPIPALGDTPEEKLHYANAAYLGGCAYNITGAGTPVDGHPAAGMAFGNCSLNQEVLGSGELVLGDGYVVPVFCGYPFREGDLDPRPNQPIKKIVNKYDREQNGFNVCKLILPSLRFHPYGNRWNPKSLPTPGKKSATVTKALASSSTPSTSVTSDTGQSLGAFARTHKKVPAHEAMTDLKHTASGFEPFSYRYYCTKDRVSCYSLSVQMPTAAKRNEQFNSPYIGLFQFELRNSSGLAVIQGTTGPPSESGITSREDMINTKVNWYITYVPADHYSGVGPGKLLNEELTEVSGIPTRFTTFSNPTSSEPIITYMASYLVPGVFVHVRCTVPEKVSGDFQSICETVLRSMEVPMPKPVPVAADDPPAGDDPPESGDPQEQND